MDSTTSTGKTKQPRGARRIWTIEEEKVLIDGLKELLAQGWKADNSFRGGYTTVLEKRMQQHFPGTDIKADPHISSKMKVWKKYYGALVNMQGRTGFGWDDNKNTITVEDDEIWQGHLKVDRSAKGMRFKSWPLFKDWQDIFGRDRATGDKAQSFADVVNDTLRSAPSDDDQTGPGQSPAVDIGGVGLDNGSGTQGECSSAGKKKKGKKRRGDEDVDGRLVELLETFCAGTRDLAQRVGHEQDAKQQRARVCAELKAMDFLTVESTIVIARRLCETASDLDIFCCLPPEDKIVMVKMMLENRM